ncbi:ABC transporter permease [Actinokineospora fastidiosa]|uniref:ABC transporter permease n=1 Tax=Actinokineospora fastidiosa TaxID=1816 RepID=A0A918GQK6_9PSEU|nr:ABC transporter permease [Actinokineospora fastidiosa]GGS53978.1 ABC transporter permease [Actinokineospora fastidiosa]
MAGFALRRVAGLVLVLLTVCAATFAIFYLLPSDPALQACGKSCTTERIAELHRQMGLDKPVWQQFADYLGGIVGGRTIGTGDLAVRCGFPCFGFSYQADRPVWDLMVDRLPTTASIAAGAAVLWLVIGLSVGIGSALRKGSGLDRSLMAATLTAASLPVFFTGLMALYLVVQVAGLLPFPTYVDFGDDPLGWARNLILPWIVLALLYAAMYARLSRSSMIETLSEPYIRTARAKGLPERVVVIKHGLRSALTPIVTVFGMDLGTLLGGAIITESVFGLPGIGQLTIDAINKSDQPVVMGVALLAAFFITLFTVLVDLLYAVVDPRVRVS